MPARSPLSAVELAAKFIFPFAAFAGLQAVFLVNLDELRVGHQPVEDARNVPPQARAVLLQVFHQQIRQHVRRGAHADVRHLFPRQSCGSGKSGRTAGWPARRPACRPAGCGWFRQSRAAGIAIAAGRLAVGRRRNPPPAPCPAASPPVRAPRHARCAVGCGVVPSCPCTSMARRTRSQNRRRTGSSG